MPDDRARSDLEIWMLGAGHGSAPVAAAFGSGYAHAHFLNVSSGEKAVENYRNDFRPNNHRTSPAQLLAVRVITAETERDAARLTDAALLWRSRKDLGEDRPLPGPEEAEAHTWTEQEMIRRTANAETIISGTPAQVRCRMESLAERNGVDELMINSPIAAYTDRLTSYHLLAAEFRRPRCP
jgi:luciferase family oxidoreductase group 1